MIALALAAATVTPTHYECVMETPKALRRGDHGVALDTVTFSQATESDWHFAVALDRGAHGKGIDATVNWPKDLIQIAGRHAAVVTAAGSVAFFSASSGPCMFTESMCLTLVNMARQPDNSVKFVVLPAALTSDTKADSREPFVVLAEGSCKEVIQ